MEGPTVAIYLDFENLAISAETVYPSRDKPLSIEPIVDFGSSKGIVCLKKAYADWTKDIFSQYQTLLMEQGFELIHLPETNSQGKNGSDVRLAIDVMEFMELFPHIEVIIIGSGDTDFIPLIQRLRTRGKQVIILGFEHSVGKLVKRNSAEFKSLEELIGEPEEESLSSDLKEETDASYGRALMRRFIKNRSEEGPVLMAKLKQQLLRLDPSFSEKDLGFPSFKLFVQSLTGDLIEKIDTQHSTLPLVHLNDLTPESQAPPAAGPNGKEHAEQFLNKKLRYQSYAPYRLEMSDALIKGFEYEASMSMNQMFEYVHEHLETRLPRTDIKKYINTLFTGGAFIPFEKKANGPLLSRPFCLKNDVHEPESLDQIYIQRVSEILQSRYTELKDYEILELLI